MAKSEIPFDQFIKEKLDEYSAQDTPVWSVMQEKLEAAEHDLLFDQKIKQTLEHLKVDSPQIGWEPFREKRNRQLARTNKIISARVIESCLIILLLWTLDNIGITHLINPSHYLESKTHPLAEGKSGSAILEDVATNHSIEESKDELGKAHPLAEGKSGSAILEDDATIYSIEESKDELGNSKILNDHKIAGLYQITNDPKEKGFNRKKIANSIRLDESTLRSKLNKPGFFNPTPDQINLVDATKKKVLTLNPSLSISSPEDDCSDEHQLASLTYAAQDNLKVEEKILSPLDIQIQPLPIEDSKLNLQNPLPVTIVALKPVIKNSILLNVHSGLMMNVIRSPSYTNFNSTKLYSQLRPGFLSAVHVGFKSNNYMVESGLTYQYLSYEPNQFDVLGTFNNGYFKLHFRKITSHILTIPVLLHYTIMKGPSWSVSSKAGLSLSASLKNDFTLDTIPAMIPERNSLVFDLNNSTISSRVKNTSNQGILDGGDFGVNSYTNLVIGIRYNRQLSSNLFFYTEFELNKMLGTIGFGPNGDRFISGNFNTGISFRL